MIDIHECANGLRIVSENIPHAQSASVGVFVQVGSRNEAPHENGLTHFIEHMLFKGTVKRSAKDIAREFDRIGGDMNAYTSKEYTCYYATVLSAHAERTVDVLADMYFNSVMNEDEIVKERQVVLEEIHMAEDTPDDDVHEQLWAVMYPGNSIGAPILGTEETLASFNAPVIRDFMARHYISKNTVISVAGRIQPKLIELIEKKFGTFERQWMEEPQQTPVFVTGTSMKKKDTEQAHLCLGFPGAGLLDEEIFSAAVLNNLLGGTMSSRLFQEVREELGLAYSIYSYHSAYDDHGTFAIYAGTANDQLEQLREVIGTTIEKLRNEGIKGTELEDSKEQLKGSLLLGLESTSARMSRNGRQLLLLGKLEAPAEALRKIDAVTEEQVMKMLKENFTEPAVSIVSAH